MRAIGIFVLIIVACVIFVRPAVVANFDQITYDILTRRLNRGSPSGDVVIVQIDEASLGRFGRWPWPRNLLADLIQRIFEEGADTVALDMMFPEPDSRELRSSTTGKAGSVRPTPGPGMSQDRRTADDSFTESLDDKRVIVGYQLQFGSAQLTQSPCVLHPVPLAIVDTEKTRGEAFFRASSAVCSIQEISRAVAGSGFLNAAAESDGILRRVPLLIAYGEDVYPSLSLAAFMVHQRDSSARLTTSSRGAVELGLNDETIPVDMRSNLLLRFRGAGGTFPRVSAVDVLTRRVPSMALRDKIVIVGVSAAGLQDVVPTSTDNLFPGFEVHATAIDNLLQNDSFRRSTGVLAWELVLMLALGLACAVLLAKLSSTWLVPVGISLIFAAWLLSALLISRTGLYLSPLPVTAVLVGDLAFLTFWRISTEKSREVRQLETTRKFILTALTTLTTIRDVETGAHVLRVQRYSEILCKALARRPRFRQFLTPKNMSLIVQLAPIHDVGKVGIPDYVLRKPDRLTREEFEIMKTHAEQGLRVLQSASFQSQIQDETTLKLACDVVYTHHERWDGAGYPQGLRGETIPIAGRILAVADVYDALVTKRIYKEGMKHEKAVQVIAEGSGSQFDPEVIDVFLEIHEAMHRIEKVCRDQKDVSLIASVVGPAVAVGNGVPALDALDPHPHAH